MVLENYLIYTHTFLIISTVIRTSALLIYLHACYFSSIINVASSFQVLIQLYYTQDLILLLWELRPLYCSSHSCSLCKRSDLLHIVVFKCLIPLGSNWLLCTDVFWYFYSGIHYCRGKYRCFNEHNYILYLYIINEPVAFHIYNIKGQ